MAISRGSPYGFAGSARVLATAAVVSATLHIFALAIVHRHLTSLSSETANAPLRAVLVELPPPGAVQTPIKPAAPAKPTSGRNPPRSAPRTITEIDSPTPPKVISRTPAAKQIAVEPASVTPTDTVIASPGLASSAIPAAPLDPLPAGTAPEGAAPSQPAPVPPRHVRIDYTLKSSIADGHARYFWNADTSADRYTISGSIEAEGFFASVFAGRLEQESSGSFTAAGLKPDRFSLRRGGAQAEVARFDWVTGRIEHQRTRGEHVQPLTSNAQDLQSFMFQFRYEFNRLATPDRVSFAISNARKLDLYEFRVAGRERLRLPIGELDTVHLIRIAEDAGDAYEAWLSPAHDFLPVKIRFMLSGRFPVDQLATRIDIEP